MKKKFEVRPSRLGACTKLAGDIAAGQLLYRVYTRQIDYKAITDAEDNSWVVLMRHQWMVDTGLSRHQYDRAIRILKEKKLVIHQNRKLHKKDLHLKTWLRIAGDVVSAIAEIMKIPKESAPTEKMISVDSAQSDWMTEQESVSADDKNENLSENEEKGNVLVLETTNNTSVSIETIEGENKKETVWFSELTKQTTGKNLARLKSAEVYLNSQQGMSAPVAMFKVYYMWVHFKEFVEEFNSAYHMPGIPQLWAIEKQLMAVPHFIKYIAYYKNQTANDPTAEYFSLFLLKDYNKTLVSEEESKHKPAVPIYAGNLKLEKLDAAKAAMKAKEDC